MEPVTTTITQHIGLTMHGMLASVSGSRYKLQILYAVITLLFVLVVNDISVWWKSIVLLPPHELVLIAIPAAVPLPRIVGRSNHHLVGTVLHASIISNWPGARPMSYAQDRYKTPFKDD